MSTTEIVLTILVTILGSKGIWDFMDNRVKDKEKSRDEKLDELIADIRELKSDLKLTKELSKSQARSSLNKWSEKFINLGYIPRCYYVAYKTLGDDYLAAGGNSEVGEKFTYIIENLEVK